MNFRAHRAPESQPQRPSLAAQAGLAPTVTAALLAALCALSSTVSAQPGAGAPAPGASASITTPGGGPAVEALPVTPSRITATPLDRATESAALPAGVLSALRRAQVPAEAMAAYVQEVGDGPIRLAWNAHTPMNPASVFKLLTTYAGLDLLGPAWRWKTPVWTDGTLHDGTLRGSVYLRGSGDPSLVQERVWLLLRQLQAAGITSIQGDIVLDNSAFKPMARGPEDFDGESHRPYNVQADALLLNFKSSIASFRPEPDAGVARVTLDPPLDGWATDSTVRLVDGPCGNWRDNLRATVDDAARLHFEGGYPASCDALNWPLAYADPLSYNARLVARMWQDLGGRLSGRVRDGLAPLQATPLFEFDSPPLAEVIRDINKYSNNVMADQLFLTLGAQFRPGAEAASKAGIPSGIGDSRDVMRRWLYTQAGEAALKEAVIDNGSGLSREARVSAGLLGQVLESAWRSPVMPELISSLPVNGVDGTMRRSQTTRGRAHVKTGTLRDVTAMAGFAVSESGRRWVIVGLVDHPNAVQARAALEALLQWTLDEGPPRDSRTASSGLPMLPTAAGMTGVRP